MPSDFLTEEEIRANRQANIARVREANAHAKSQAFLKETLDQQRKKLNNLKNWNPKTCELSHITWGTLNPFFKKKITEFVDFKNKNPISVALKLAKDANNRDSRLSSVPELRGIVLREENLAAIGSNTEYISSQSQKVKSNHQGRMPQQPEHLPAYKIWIPEPDSMLTVPCRITEPGPEDSKRIDKFRTFVAANSEIPTASVGQTVRVTFYNWPEGPIYLGPVHQKAQKFPIEDAGRPSASYNSVGGKPENPNSGDPVGE